MHLSNDMFVIAVILVGGFVALAQLGLWILAVLKRIETELKKRD